MKVKMASEWGVDKAAAQRLRRNLSTSPPQRKIKKDALQSSSRLGPVNARCFINMNANSNLSVIETERLPNTVQVNPHISALVEASSFNDAASQ